MYALNTELSPVTDTGPLNAMRCMVVKIQYIPFVPRTPRCTYCPNLTTARLQKLLLQMKVLYQDIVTITK